MQEGHSIDSGIFRNRPELLDRWAGLSRGSRDDGSDWRAFQALGFNALFSTEFEHGLVKGNCYELQIGLCPGLELQFSERVGGFL